MTLFADVVATSEAVGTTRSRTAKIAALADLLVIIPASACLTQTCPMGDVEDAMATADEFLATFNAGDAAGHAATLGYPHVRLASGTVRIWETIEEATAQMAANMRLIRERIGWDHSRWDHKRLIHAGENKVHLDVQFTRYRADGSVIGAYPAVYVVVRTDGRWVIQCRSSYAP